MDPIADAISLIRNKREDALAEVRRLDDALAVLEGLVQPDGGSTQARSIGHGDSQASVKTKSPSVRTKALTLMDEGPADWSVNDILAEYQQRNDPIHGNSPKNALRAAIADAHTKGLVDRIAPGRYRSAKFRNNMNGSAAPTREVVMP